METISNIVQALANNIMELMPFLIIKSYERGVRWTWGQNPIELLPGLHLRIWLMHSVETGSVVDNAIHLPHQTVTCEANGKVYHYRLNMGYRITDIVKHYCNVNNFKEVTMAIAMRHVAKRIRKEPPDDLTKLEKSLETTLTTQFKDWGTDVFAVGFTDFAEVETRMRLFGDDDVFSHIEA